jgi:hypothetical protein
MGVLLRRRPGVTNVFPHRRVGQWCILACHSEGRKRREVRIRAASAEAGGFEVVSEPFTVGLINLRGCLGGVGSPITAPHAATLLGESCWLKANCSSVELAYVAAGSWADFLIS